MIKKNAVSIHNAIEMLVPKETAVSYKALDSKTIFFNPPATDIYIETAKSERNAPAHE